MTITIHIDSPELTSAIRDLTGVMLSAAMNSAVKVNIQEPAGQPAPMQPQQVLAPVQPPAPVSFPQPAPAVAPIAPVPQPTPTAAPPQAPTVAPTAAVSYTISQLSVAAMQLKDQGRIADLQGLLAQFGVQAMTQLRPDQLPDFAMALIGMGVKI